MIGEQMFGRNYVRVMPVIGCFIVEGIQCSIHGEAAPGPSAVFSGNKIVDVSRSARMLGIKPGMTGRQAQICYGDVRLFECDQARYAGAIEPFLERCCGLTPLIEPRGQFFFADFKGTQTARERIPDTLNAIFAHGPYWDCSVYAGFAPGKCLAWSTARALQDEVLEGTYSDPTGVRLAWFEASAVEAIISRLPVRYIWSLDEEVASELVALGLRTFADIKRAGLQNLIRRYGQKGRHIHRYSTGLDSTPVLPLYPPRTISVERVLETFLDDGPGVYDAIASAASEIWRKMSDSGDAYQRMSLCIRSNGRQFVASRDFPRPQCNQQQLTWASTRLFVDALKDAQCKVITGLTLEISALCRPVPVQAGLVDVKENALEGTFDKSMVSLAPAMGALQRRYGFGLLRAGIQVVSEESRREEMLSHWDPVRWRG
jgi:nucleotidyltransferase/DNA polymerase involved in DNA repair